MSTGPRLLRATPRPDGDGWSVVDTRSGDLVATTTTSAEALEQAPALLPRGGTVEAVAGGFVVGRRSVSPPPAPPRVLLLAAAVRVGLALLLAALVGWLFDVSAARIVIGSALVGGLLSVLWGTRAHRRAQRRARDGATTGEPHP